MDKILEVAPQLTKMELFHNAYTSDLDVGNILEAVKPVNATLPHDFIDKLSCLSPIKIYHHMDEFSRDAVVYLANDLGLGMGISIAAMSFAIKFAFMPLMFASQLNSLKMKLLEPETKNY